MPKGEETNIAPRLFLLHIILEKTLDKSINQTNLETNDGDKGILESDFSVDKPANQAILSSNNLNRNASWRNNF